MISRRWVRWGRGDWVKACLLLLAPVVLLACGGGSGSIALDDLGQAVLDRVCGESTRCGSFPDVATCRATLMVDLGQLKAEVAAGHTTYDGTAAAKCLNALASQSCKLSEQVELPSACDDTFRGTLAPGSACFVNEACNNGSCDKTGCSDTSMCCAGTCVARTVAAVGETCSGVDVECVSGAFCAFTGTTSTCMPRAAAGQPCAQLAGCEAGFYCDMADGATTGTCQKAPAEGESCAGSIFFCDDSRDFCDSATMKCLPKIAVGGDCSGSTGCVTYARCDATTQKCVARGVVGDVCTDGTGCQGGLACTNGSCAAPPPDPICP